MIKRKRCSDTLSALGAGKIMHSWGAWMTCPPIRLRSTALVIAVSILCGLIPGAAFAEATATVETRVIASGRSLRGVTFSTTEKGWAVGTGGSMFSTADAGATWTQRSSGVTGDLLDIDFVDEQHGWAVGAGGTVLRTENGGETWVNEPTGVSAIFNSVEFVDRRHGWLIGSDPTLVSSILATTDGGRTWTRQAAQGAAGMLDVEFQDPLRGVAVGYLGAAFRTDDGGQTWSPIPMPEKSDAAFYSVAVDGDTVLIGAQFGVILRSEDAGATWTESNVMGEIDIHAVTLAGDLALAAGEAGSLALSDDAGESWSTLPTTTTAILRRAAIAGGRGYVVGDAGRFVTVTPKSDGIPGLTDLPIAVGKDSCDALLEPRILDEPSTVALDATPADLDGDGNEEIVLGTLDGLAALKPFVDPSAAEIWRFNFHARVQDVTVVELDGDPGAELIGVTRRSRPERDGVFAVNGDDGELLWGKHVAGGLDRVEVADLNGDGVDDVAAIGQARAVYLFNGRDGALVSNPKMVEGEATDIDVGDITGDGLADVAVVTADGIVAAFRGGDYARVWSRNVEDSSFDYLGAVEVADVDGDGVSEVAVAGHAIPAALLPGSGDGTTTIGGRRGAYLGLFEGDGMLRWDFADPGSGHMRALKLADLTGDGVLDVVSHGNQMDSGYLYAFDGGGDPSLAAVGEPQLLWSSSTTRNGPLQVVKSEAISFDAISTDGKPDPIVGVGNGSVLAFEGDPATAPSPGRPRPGSVLWEFRRATGLRTVASFTSDGASYVLSLSEDGLLAVLDEGTGDRLWSFGTGYDTVVSGVDHDGDGIDEVAAGSRNGSVFVTDLDGVSLPQEDIFMPGSVTALVASDVQGDGDEEVVAADDLGNLWAIEPATGARVWTIEGSPTVASLAAGGGTLLAGMSNGDVRGFDPGTGEDVWAASMTGSAYSVGFDPALGFVAASPGVPGSSGDLAIFSPDGEVVNRISVSAGQVNIGDIDGDDQPEIVVSSGFSVRAYDASLSLEWSLPLPSLVVSVTLADLDGDGVKDAAATSGSRVFGVDGRTGRDLWEADGGAWSFLTAMDVQGDGDEEIIAATSFAGPFGLIEVGGGNGLRTLDGDGTRLAGCELVRGPADVTSLDLDGDGHTEAVSGGNVGGVYVFVSPERKPAPDPDITPTPDPDITPTPTPTPTEGSDAISALEILDSTSDVVQHSDPATLDARLTDVASGLPLAGREVTFMIEGRNGYRTATGLTGADGVVSLSHKIDLRPGDFVLVASVEQVPGSSSASDSTSLKVLREDVGATLELTGSGSNRTLHAVLKDADDAAAGVAGRVVRFFVEGDLIGTSKTDSNGDAYLAVPKDVRGSGERVEVVFDGDGYFRAASAATST